MLAIEKIREDLVEVRYYYTRKKVFDEAKESVGTNMILAKVKRYNEAMRQAPPLLYDLYVCLYTRNYTQEGLSLEWNYTPQYIQKLNKKLLLFLQTQIQG